MYQQPKPILASLALLLLAAAWPLAAGEAPQRPLAQSFADAGDADAIDVAAYWVSEKLDGVYARWDGSVLRSRRGNRFHAPSWFLAGFPAQPLDGELWLGRGTFDALSGIVRRKTPDDAAWRTVRFMAFDLPAHPGDFDARLRRMKEVFAALDAPWLGLVEQRRVRNRAELMALLEEVASAGGEGLMLHKANALYRAGRTSDLLKLKRRQDGEATVLAHLPGKGKFAGMMGALLVETPDGRRFRLGTGFTDEERRRPPPVGAVVVYRHYGATGTGLPRFASFLRMREGR